MEPKTTNSVVDCHFHLWSLARGDYHWLTPDITELYKDFNPSEFQAVSAGVKVAKAVIVQATDTNEETDYLLLLAQENAFIAGVVGWIDFEADTTSVIQRLNQLSGSSAFKGVRPMLQDIDDVNWILNSAFTPIFEHMSQSGLTFDALVRTEHLAAINHLARHHPNLQIVINHCAKPNIENGDYKPWAKALSTFKSLNNVFIKVSGLTLEASAPQQSEEHFLHYFNHAYQVFGANRMMWGSDWPVVNLKSSYSDWFAISESLFATMSVQEKQTLLAGTATQFYQLDP